MTQLEAIIGLEVHAQMSTKTKMFCGCDNDAFDKEPNTTVCPICMGHPGTLPVVNAQALEKAIAASLALQGTVHEHCHFDRKHYFYPDLPMGFQISQYDFPLSTGGYVDYDLEEAPMRCRIHRLHIENDAGKLTHVGRGTLCDYNRAGTPLMEIVTEPDLRSSAQARAFAEELRRILIAVGASEADMFKGMMRFDASISLRESGTEHLNPRSEIKNLNSFRALERALVYEEKRLRDLWQETGGPLPGNITVGWNDDDGVTRLLRDKESAADYRYFPEPDIPPLHVTQERIDAARAALPPLPRTQRQAYRAMGLNAAEALQLMDSPALLDRFEAVRTATKDGRRAASLVLTQLLGFLNAAGKEMQQAPAADDLVALVRAVDDGTISANAAKEVLEAMVQTGKQPRDIITEKGLTQIADTGALEELVRRAIEANPQAIDAFRSGKAAALGAVVGWVMKESKGKANPAVISEMLQRHLAA